MSVVQISTRIDENIRNRASNIFSDYGLDIPTALRIFITTAVKEQRFPIDISKKTVSFNGDEFENDTQYFKQIPGYWESIVEASNEPLENLSTAKECGWNKQTA